MIGNDLVDLAAAKQQSNWQRPGWLKKIFLPTEQDQILKAQHPEVAVWQHWSRKEAAYKAHQRLYNHAPKFNPIQLDTSDPKLVKIGADFYTTLTTYSNNLIHSTATMLGLSQKISYQIFNCSDMDYKPILLSTLAKAFKVETSQLSLAKNEHQIPQLIQHASDRCVPLSISHHGAYFACAWITPETTI